MSLRDLFYRSRWDRTRTPLSDEVIFYTCCDEQVGWLSSARSSLARGLRVSEDKIKTKRPSIACSGVPLDRFVEHLCSDIDQVDPPVDWVLFDVSYLLKSGGLTARKIKRSLGEVFRTISRTTVQGVLVLDVVSSGSRDLFYAAWSGYDETCRPRFISSVFDIEVAVRGAESLTIWSTGETLLSFASRTGYPPGTGVLEAPVPVDCVAEAVADARLAPDGPDIATFARGVGIRLVNSVDGMTARDGYAGDPLTDAIRGGRELQPYGHIFSVSDKESHFPLPVEFVESDCVGDMWCYKYAVMHQLPGGKSPPLDLPPRPTKVLIVNAADDRTVQGFQLPDGTMCDQTLIRLPGARIELRRLKNLLADKTIAGQAKLCGDIGTWDPDVAPPSQWDREFEVVHFIGHAGIVDGQIFFHWPHTGKRNFTIGWKRFLELIGGRKLWLLHLSACEIGQSAAVRELAKRVRFVVAHRWPLIDEQGPLFSEAFYRRLLEGYSNPAEALLMARRDLRRRTQRATLSAILVGGVR